MIEGINSQQLIFTAIKKNQLMSALLFWIIQHYDKQLLKTYTYFVEAEESLIPLDNYMHCCR